MTEINAYRYSLLWDFKTYHALYIITCLCFQNTKKLNFKVMYKIM